MEESLLAVFCWFDLLYDPKYGENECVTYVLTMDLQRQIFMHELDLILVSHSVRAASYVRLVGAGGGA